MSENCLDGLQPAMAGEYADQVCEGIRAFFRVIIEHAGEWGSLLEQCKGFEVRYQPMINNEELEKQYRDLNLFDGFQRFSSGRLEGYFRRMGRRMGLSGEEVLRWVSPEWKEPAAKLSEGMVRSWLSGTNVVFTRQLGSRSVMYRIDGISREGSNEYFAHDYLVKAISLAQGSEKSSGGCTDVRRQFLSDDAPMAGRAVNPCCYPAL